jgi:hypothetical protein
VESGQAHARLDEGESGPAIVAGAAATTKPQVSLGSGDDAPALLATADASCTYPTVGEVNFSTAAFSGSNSDTGPQNGARTREGDFEVIEMDEIVDGGHGTLSVISHLDKAPANCAQIATAWQAGGYWSVDADADLAPPGGGLYGSESMVDVPQGTIFMLNAVALDGFSARTEHTRPGTGQSALDSVNDGVGSSGATALVPFGNTLLQMHYERPEDAVSALFMTDTLSGVNCTTGTHPAAPCEWAHLTCLVPRPAAARWRSDRNAASGKVDPWVACR